jgi:homoserine kinase
VETDLAVATGRENLCVRAFERLHPADGFTFRIRSEIPLSGGLGSSAAAIVAGLMAADHMFELDATCSRRRPTSRATPTTSPRRCSAASSCARTARPRASIRRRAWRRWRSCRRRRCARARRGRRCPEVPLEEAVFNVAHGALLTLGLARGDWDLLGRGLQDRLHQQRRAHLFPRSFELAGRARELGALGATISGAGPTVLVWCFYEQTGAVAEALAPEVEGWASVLRTSFEPQGAYVDEL